MATGERDCYVATLKNKENRLISMFHQKQLIIANPLLVTHMKRTRPAVGTVAIQLSQPVSPPPITNGTYLRSICPKTITELCPSLPASSG